VKRVSELMQEGLELGVREARLPPPAATRAEVRD
jgi:hypothetical protein